MTTALQTTGSAAPWYQPRSFDDAIKLSEDISRSGLAPKDYNTPQKIFIAIVHGAELGLSAMQALQGIAIVNGRPCIWGTTLQALVQRSGLVKRRAVGCLPLPAIEKIRTGVWKGKTDSNSAMVDALAARLVDRMEELAARRGKDGPLALPPGYLCGYAVFQIGDDIHVQIFDSCHAQTAGLLGKGGPWTQYPERMHQHRAVTYLSRDQCGAALAGLAGQMTAEEAMDEGAIEVHAEDVTKPATAAAMAEMQATPAGSGTADAPPVPSTDDDALAAARARLASANARLKTRAWHGPDTPMTDRERKVAINQAMKATVGELKTVTEMTADELVRVADALDALQPLPPDEDPKARGWSNNRGDVVGRDNPGGLLNPDPPPSDEFNF